MRRRTRSTTLAVVTVAVLALAGIASAAYTTPKLSVLYSGNVTRIVASASVNDDSTARAAIYVPAGTSLPGALTPGTKVGTVNAQVSALALGGALLPLTGDINVAPPGAVPAASQTACIGAEVPSATLLLVLQAAGQTINLPAYLIATAGAETALGPAKLVFCLAPPDIPVASGGATFGAKFLSADMSLTSIFGAVGSGAWVGIWTPWQAGNGQINAAATVASPALIAPGAVTLTGRKVKGQRVVAGRLTQGGAGFASRVQIWGAVGKASFKLLKSVTSTGTGAFTYTVPKASKATSFQARVVAAGRTSAGACATLTTLPAPCVNATLNGFTARSKAVTLR